MGYNRQLLISFFVCLFQLCADDSLIKHLLHHVFWQAGPSDDNLWPLPYLIHLPIWKTDTADFSADSFDFSPPPPLSPACSHVPRVSAPEAGDPGPLGAPHGPVPPQGSRCHGCAAQPDGLPASSDEALGHHAAHHAVSLSALLPPPALPVIFFFSPLIISPFFDEPLLPPRAGWEAHVLH